MAFHTAQALVCINCKQVGQFHQSSGRQAHDCAQKTAKRSAKSVRVRVLAKQFERNKSSKFGTAHLQAFSVWMVSPAAGMQLTAWLETNHPRSANLA